MFGGLLNIWGIGVPCIWVKEKRSHWLLRCYQVLDSDAACPVFILQFQGGNGSSPVRGLPPVLRSPQNSHSHSAQGTAVSFAWSCDPGLLSLLRSLAPSLTINNFCCRLGKIARLQLVCLLGTTWRIQSKWRSNLFRWGRTSVAFCNHLNWGWE